MSQYDEELNIVIFTNNKDGNDARPDFTGKTTVEGVEYRVALWKRQGKNGTFLSGKLSLPQGGQKREQQVSNSFDDLNDDIPW